MDARTGTSPHLSAFAPESAGALLLPLLSHSKVAELLVEMTEWEEMDRKRTCRRGRERRCEGEELRHTDGDDTR